MTDTRARLPKFVPPTGLAPSAWLLGPKAENRAWLIQLMTTAIEAHSILCGGKGPATPAILVPATAHYSWAKRAALLGLGKAALRLIAVDTDGRMSMPGLPKT